MYLLIVGILIGVILSSLVYAIIVYKLRKDLIKLEEDTKALENTFASALSELDAFYLAERTLRTLLEDRIATSTKFVKNDQKN